MTKQRMSWAVTTALAAMLAAGPGAGDARADSSPGDDADSLTVTVTPDVNYSVDITTTDSHMALGTVGLGASTFTVRPATVAFGGTVLTGHELNLSAAITSAGTAWGFDATPATGTSISAEADKLAMYALFSSTMLAAAPTGDSFGHPAAGTGSPSVDAEMNDGDGNSSVSGVRAGGSGAAGTKFEYHENAGMANGEKDMDANKTGSANTGGIDSGTAHLWFLLRMPSSTTSGSQQAVTVTLTHTLGSL